MATGRRPGFLRPDAPVTPPPATGGGLSATDANRLLYNTLILQKTNVTELPTAMVPAPYTRGLVYLFGGLTYYRFIDANNSSSEVLTTDITNADATLRIATITRT